MFCTRLRGSVACSVCKLFGETICHMFGCGCYIVVECYGVVGGALLDRPYMVFQRVYVVPVTPVLV